MKKYLISKVFKLIFINSFLLFNFNLYAENKISNKDNLNNSKFPIKQNNLQSKESYTNPYNSYIIGPGDKVKVLFYGSPEYSKEYIILNDGSISLPFIESISLEGETLSSASKLIEEKLSKEFISPKIFLSITKARPINISVIGEINNPGYYSLQKNIKQLSIEQGIDLVPGLPTIVDVLKKAGGITRNSDLENIELTRKLPKSFSKSHQILKINLMKLLLEGDHSQNLFLFDGDVVKIARTDKTNVQQFQISNANLSPSSIKIFVIGEVINPGMHNLDAQTTLNEAIYAAGGISPRRGKLLVELYRVNKDGTSTFKKYKFNPKYGFSNENNPQLMNGDIIRVNRNFSSTVGDALQPITEPVEGLLSIYRLIDLISE